MLRFVQIFYVMLLSSLLDGNQEPRRRAVQYVDPHYVHYSPVFRNHLYSPETTGRNSKNSFSAHLQRFLRTGTYRIYAKLRGTLHTVRARYRSGEDPASIRKQLSGVTIVEGNQYWYSRDRSSVGSGKRVCQYLTFKSDQFYASSELIDSWFFACTEQEFCCGLECCEKDFLWYIGAICLLFVILCLYAFRRMLAVAIQYLLDHLIRRHTKQKKTETERILTDSLATEKKSESTIKTVSNSKMLDTIEEETTL